MIGVDTKNAISSYLSKYIIFYFLSRTLFALKNKFSLLARMSKSLHFTIFQMFFFFSKNYVSTVQAPKSHIY